MTLKIFSEEDENRQLAVTVEVPEERVREQMRRKARSLAQELRIPGFRRGKVPYNVMVNRIGESALRAEAVEDMLQPVLDEALEQIEFQPYAQPTLDDLELEPLVLKITIPLEPVVELGDYRAVRKEVEEVVVTDEAVQEAVDHVRSHHQILEEVDRPAETGDLVTLTGKGFMGDDEEDTLWSASSNEVLLDAAQTFPEVPFVDNIVGMSAGDEKSFTVTFPEDYDDDGFAGKEAHFSVEVEKVQKRELPELDDEMAQKEGDYETAEALVEALKKELHEQAEANSKSSLLDELIDDMVEMSKIVYPPAAVEAELSDMLETLQNQVTRSGWQWEDYLKVQGETEDSLRERWHDRAVKRVESGLVLRKLIQEEKIRVDQQEVDQALDERLSRYADNVELQEQLRQIYSQGSNINVITSELLMDRVHERVAQIVTGTAPSLEELAAAEEAAEGAAEEEE